MRIVVALLLLLLPACATTPPPKPIIQTQIVEVPKYIRAPIPAQYTQDIVVVEPVPLCSPKFCNGQTATMIDDYRAAVRQCNLDKAALRSLDTKRDGG